MAARSELSSFEARKSAHLRMTVAARGMQGH
jgi:methylmalonyl-CoA mutase cobalamin-binding subunit